MANYRSQLRDRKPPTSEERSPAEALPARGRSRPVSELLGAFWHLLRGRRAAIGVAIAMLTVAALLKLVPPVLTKVIIDAVTGVSQETSFSIGRYTSPSDPYDLLVICAGLIIGLSFIAVVLQQWSEWIVEKNIQRVQIKLRKRVFERSLRLPLHRAHKLKAGGLASILRDDASSPASLVSTMIYQPWRAIVQLVGTLVVLIYVDWRMMLSGLLLMPVVYLTHRTWIDRIRPLHNDLRRQRELIDAHATESLGGMRLIRAFARERLEVNRFIHEQTLLMRMRRLVWWRSRVIAIAWNALIPLASTALLLYGGHQILKGQMTLGELTMFLIYLAMLLDPLATLSNTATAFQNDLAGLDRTLDLLAESPELGANGRATTSLPISIDGALTFRNVSFRYPLSEDFVLKNIDLHVRSNETIALVGRSGAGKTTLCNLVARFYEPTEGVIELDNRDLGQLDIRGYRKLLGIVEQDVFLFDDTVSNNVAYGCRKATQAQIEEASRIAHAHEFIRTLENGYETRIGERGVRLSAGQKQRIAIARAVLSDPRILILDEATSNLDSESEQLIWDAMRKLLRGRTSFVIAHRMNTILGADRVAVLQDGQIVEVGTHSQLMETSNYYRRCVQIQTSGLASVTE